MVTFTCSNRLAAVAPGCSRNIEPRDHLGWLVGSLWFIPVPTGEPLQGREDRWRWPPAADVSSVIRHLALQVLSDQARPVQAPLKPLMCLITFERQGVSTARRQACAAWDSAAHATNCIRKAEGYGLACAGSDPAADAG
eukprot:365662-Chlamydomonas_euryale.AAC.3